MQLIDVEIHCEKFHSENSAKPFGTGHSEEKSERLEFEASSVRRCRTDKNRKLLPGARNSLKCSGVLSSANSETLRHRKQMHVIRFVFM